MSGRGVISGPYFPAFGLNTAVFGPNAGRCGPEMAPYLGTFQEVNNNNFCTLCWYLWWRSFAKRVTGLVASLCPSRFFLPALSVLEFAKCLAFLFACVLTYCSRCHIIGELTCLRAWSTCFYLFNSFICVLLMVSYKKIMVWQLKHSLQMYKCMLTDASLKAEIVKNNKKSHEDFL